MFFILVDISIIITILILFIYNNYRPVSQGY